MKENKDAEAKKLGAIKKVEVEGDDNKTYTFYFKQPHRHVLGLSFARLDINPVEANEILVNNCIIKEVSDFEMLTDDSIFFSVMKHLGDLSTVKKSQSTML
jgi:hypothetical protein